MDEITNSCKHCCKSLVSTAATYCSNRCQVDYQYQQYINRWKGGAVDGSRGISTKNFSKHIMRYIWEKYDGECARCGWRECGQGQAKPPLEIEHIDGNADNNIEVNLILLCPNCHAITATYKNRNKGKGRLWRKQKYMLQ